MGSTKVKKPLQLIKSINPRKSTQKNINKENSVCINDYYDRIEHYAQQIRSTDDLIEIINILDVALLETRNLHHSSNEVNKAQEQVQRTEQDIVALKNELEILKELVHTDQSTGALNRRGLDTSLLREYTHADQNNISLCLVLLELDDFKLFNDIYGHQAGDQALMYLVNIIKKSLRPSDIIARFGREEFVLLLSNTTMELAKLITKRLQDNLAENHLLDADQSIPITFSAGVAERTRYEHQNSVIGRAKRALYPTKNTGKNQIVAAGRN